MRAAVQTTLIRDRQGYDVRDYGQPAFDPKLTLLGRPPSGIHIVGRSGLNELVTISTASNLRLWVKASQLVSPEQVAGFMTKWGQLSRWIGDDGSRPYEEPFILLEPHLNGLRQLAGYVEAGDRDNFYLNLKNNRLLDRANLTVDVQNPESALVLEAPSLLRFMLIEMWNEFGGERPANLGFRSCRYCGLTFQVGGRRYSHGRRADARYCSASCKNMASRKRTKGLQSD